MAGQKPAARQGQARSQKSRQGAATATTKANASRNGPAAGKSRPAASTAGKPRPAGASATARPDSASQAASPPPSGFFARLVVPFRTVGPVPLATFVLSLYALAASIYLTITHFDPQALICSGKGIVNCAEVTTSPQSMVFGIFPVAILGLAFYVFMAALNSPWVWRLQQTGSEQLSSILRNTRVGAIVVGMGFVLYLIYAELIQIDAICLWCTSVHVATFLIFALIVFYTSFSTSSQARTGRG
jgi:uncharacterized membrane protein